MHDRQAGLEVRVAEIGEEDRQLRRGEHAFVHQRALGQAGHVEELFVGDAGRAYGLLCQAAHDVEASLESGVIHGVISTANEDLAERGLRGLGGRSDRRVVDRHVAPAQQGQAFVPQDLLEQGLTLLLAAGIAWQEHDARTVVPGWRETQLLIRATLFEEAVRHLHQDARAVARVLLRAAGAAMLEIGQNRQRLLDGGVRAAPLDVDDKADAAGVVFEGGIVETLLGREAKGSHVRAPHLPRRIRAPEPRTAYLMLAS